MRFLFSLIVALGLLGAPAAHAVIVPGSNIHGVRPGDTEADVKKDLGRLVTTTGSFESGNRKVVFSRRLKLVVALQRSSRKQPFRVTYVQVDPQSKERTRSGIGIGSSIAALRRAYPGVTCTTTICTLRRRGSSRVTYFHHRGAKITTIFLQRV